MEIKSYFYIYKMEFNQPFIHKDDFFSNFDAPKYLPIMFIGRNYISRVILVPSFKYYGQAITKYGIEKID